ncbi:T9SS type A sorting domain-containing protein [candidate division KSB1 bacterium]|nr:T9SS type A sorting domain-containing protein [candidate division KSB1 bacterium]
MKRAIEYALILIVTIFFNNLLIAQETGYSDSFEGDMKVSGPPSFSFIQENGVLKIIVDKETKTWQGFTYEIGETVDITLHPFMNLNFKTDVPFLLTAYIVDTADNNMTQNVKVYATETYVTYCIDFSEYVSKGVDASRISSLIFTPNGNTNDGLVGVIMLDELKLGTDAEMLAGVGGIVNQLVFENSTDNRINVLDLNHAASIVITGAESLVTDVSAGDIFNGLATITYDCQSGITGNDTLTVTAVGTSGYSDNPILIPIEIEGNNPPSMNAVPEQDVMAGDTITVQLMGITDGNATVEQPLIINASSDNQEALPDTNISIDYIEGETVARLTYIPVQAAPNIEIGVSLDDQYPENNSSTIPVIVNVYAQYNYAPTIDYIPNQFTYLSSGKQSFTLTGISDGDDGPQNIIFTITSSEESVITDANITINYTQGESTAEFIYIPENTGTTILLLTIQDEGGTGANNGNAQVQLVFDIEVGLLPLDGYAIPMDEFVPDTTDENVGDWKVEGLGTAQVVDFGSFHGKDNVIKIDLVEKGCWAGIWYHHPELNLDEHRYLCYDIYFEGGDFASDGSGKTHSYYWDADDERNLPRAHEERKTVPADQWETVLMDYRGAGGMDNDAGDEINVNRIQKALINYASSYDWPFPVDNGTVYLTNIKLGSAVPDDIIPVIASTCTIDPVADQTLFLDQGEQTISLTGISNGNDDIVIVTVTATSSTTSFIPHPIVSEVDAEGKATLTYQPGEGTGSATINLNVSAEGSNERSISFQVDVVTNDPGNAATVEIIIDSLYQTIRGFGTYSFSGSQNYIDYYTDDLGASAMRVGIIGNQVEPENDNNDPNILNMDALDYNAFDFEYYRQLKESGVETFILTSWSPPAWMKRNMSESYAYAAAPFYEDTDNILEPYYYDEFAETMLAVIKMFKSEAGIDLAAIGPQNEPAFCEPYPSAVLGPEQFAELVAVVGEKFKLEGLSTKIYMPEQVFTQFHYSMAQYIDAIKANPDADKYTGIIAAHGYDTDGIGEAQPNYEAWSTMWDQSQNCQYPKEFWMTETYPTYENWNSALSLAGAIHGALVYGNVGLWTLWNIEGTLMFRGEPTASFYASKNYYKYIRPGSRRIKVVSGHDDILASSFIHNEDKTLTTVLINKNSEPLTVTIAGDSIPVQYDVYTSAENMNFIYQGNFNYNESIALPANSVTTLVGQTDGAVTTVEAALQIPKNFRLDQNYPNPFNPETIIQFRVPVALQASLKIYNVLGQQVRTLFEKEISPGEYTFIWDGTNDLGMSVASGIYMYQMKTEKYISVKKCILLR